ncbi:MAG: phenylalanine--tRNA ligase subunit beta [Acidobacteria bacterium]|nr:MAG: phenylalanine--tRNA ligase subunit beta [Acidobacteriota bacterium]
MKISLNWIADYTTLPAGLTPREIAHQLTMATVEVEGVHETDGDVVFEIDNKSLTNRPDLWGHYGVARELAAIYQVPLKPLPGAEPALPKASLVGYIDPAVCRRFTATRIENVTVLETPAWMKQRLVAIGQRSKNLYADLTNYVMLATGQPTHAFDANRLTLPLSVRRAHDKEAFHALDGTALTLTAADAVVADGKGPVGLAGVIGGMDSAIQAGTTRVLFEAANFDPLAIRRTAATHGIRTEASTRFEKSLSTHRIDEARRLFFHLLKDIDPGARVTGFDDTVNAATAPGEIRASAAYLRDRIGKDLSIAELRAPLERLGFGVDVDADQLTVTVPEWRHTGDVSGPHDLVEEIARLHGYERFEFQAPAIRLETSARDYSRSAERRVKEYLALGCGMQEVINYPWTEDRFVIAAGFSPDAANLRLSAPPAPDQATLRTSLVPGLLRAIESNIRWRSAFRIFESGSVFPSGQPTRLDDDRERLPPQQKHIAAALVGDEAESLFREAKGAIEALAQRAHVAPLTLAAGGSAPWADAGACLSIASGGLTIGHVGVLARRGTRAAGLKHAFAAVFEFALDGLRSSPSRDNKYVALPELPSVDVDVSLTYADNVAWADIAEAARGVDPLIAAIEFIDQYRGKGIPDGHRSITLRARLQPTSQTLTSEEAVAIANLIREVERQKFGASER